MKKYLKQFLKNKFPRIYNFLGYRKLISIRKSSLKKIKANADNAFIHSSRSLHYSSDLTNEYPLTGNPYLNLELDMSIDIKTIFLQTDSIDMFYLLYLKKLQHPFILITGDSDTSLSCENFRYLNNILKNDNLIKWYAQNLDHNHEKLKFLPIGVDYHTSDESIFTQNRKLKTILENAQPIRDRSLSCYCNWHFFLNRGDRKKCFESVDKNLCFYEPERVPREKSWKKNSEYTFTLSPQGGGVDCHRTYESIVLGSIPILKKNSITKHLEHLPIVILDDWSEISRDLLIEKKAEILNSKYDFSEMIYEFWAAKIYQNQRTFKKMTMDEFMQFLIRNL